VDNRAVASDVVILVCDGADRWRRVDRRLRRRGNAAGAALTTALQDAAPADVVLMSGDCTVADGWLERLREAAYSDGRVATATAMTWDRGTSELDAAAATIAESSLRLRPSLPGVGGCCIFVRRAALDLAGPPDPGFRPGTGAERTFASACVRKGLRHVLADDVLVASDHRSAVSASHDLGFRSNSDELGPLVRSLSHARRALGGLSVLIDARVLTGPVTGTHVHLLELISAVARMDEVRLAVLMPETPNAEASARIATLPAVTQVGRAQATALRADLVHRPYQVNNPGDLTLLASLGERLVVTHQDLISYRNPYYFQDTSAWLAYRRLTRLALAVADHVVFFSAHVRDDALAEDLVDPGRATVVHIGVDHSREIGEAAPEPPSRAAELPPNADLILCIGTDFHHKNRVFALRMLDELGRGHQWTGHLVFIGPTVQHGSSRAEERQFIAEHPAIAARAHDLGPVSEGEKAWLLERAVLVLYPTVDEGFGLIPFEAADHGVPCMWGPGTSLDELLPAGPGGLVAWDVAASARRAMRLLRPGAARDDALASVRAAARKLTWKATAAGLVATYAATCDSPPTAAGALERHHGVTSGGLTEDAMRLVGPGGALPTELERPLLALATNPRFGRPVFAALRGAYRAGFWARRYRRR
jgi:glycosyltransferase involved in cell wall biosynthesis